jgi:hypothetical protein
MPATFGVVLFMIVVSFIILAAIEMKSRRQAKSAPETQESQCCNAESSRDSIQQQGF